MKKSLRYIFGSNVRSLRESLGYSKSVFCLMVGISRPQLIRIEQGKSNIKIDTIQAIAEGLDADVWTLMRPMPTSAVQDELADEDA